MKVKSVIALLIVLMLITSSCTNGDPENVPNTRHRIEGTTIYNDTDFFNGITPEITYNEYISIASEKYGVEALEIQQSPSYTDKNLPPVEGYTWNAVHVRLYDETRDINSYVTFGFLNDEFQWAQTGSLVYCESESDFKKTAEKMISQSKHIFEDMESAQSNEKWKTRTYTQIDDGNLVRGFGITIALPDSVSSSPYKIDPYEVGNVGVILFDIYPYYTEPYPESGTLNSLDYSQFLSFGR